MTCVACNGTRVASSGSLCEACTPSSALKPDISPHLLAFGDQASELATAHDIGRLLESLVINTDAEYDMAGKYLQQATALSKALEAKRKAITGPMMQAKRELDGWIKPIVKVYDAAGATLKRKILEYQGRKMAEKQAIAEQMRAQHAQGNIGQVMQLAAQAQVTSAPVLDNVTMRKRWKFRIVDLNALPREYMVPNDTAIRLAMSNGIHVPGVEYYQEDEIAVRT